MLLDWVEIDMFSNMPDSVNTSLGVHLFENLQALNVGIENIEMFSCPLQSLPIILD